MFKLALVLCLLFVLSYANRDQQWKQFKSNYKKVYKDQTEEMRRRKNWEDNLDKIKKHNEAYKKGVFSYSVGINEYSDLSLKDALKKLTGFIATENITGNYLEVPRLAALQLPSSVDYRTGGFVTPVKTQGSCGACWAFSATGAIEAQLVKKNRQLVSQSEQNFVDCVQYGCTGGSMDDAFTYAKSYGVDTAASYPYKEVQGACKYEAATVGAKVQSITFIQDGNEADLQNAVANHGPVSIAIDATYNFVSYAGGYFSDTTCSSYNVNHGMLVVGYDTDPLYGPYWLVKNSWGTSWGEGGYIKIARNKNMCGIADYALYPTIE